MENEPIESINKWLKDKYGSRVDDARQRVRVVWSEDQVEKQYTKFTDTGIELMFPQVREVPKYRQWASNKYILEILTVTAGTNDEIAAGEKLSYEPLWTFQTPFGDALPPRRDVIEAIMTQVQEAMTRTPGQKKYVEEEINHQTNEAIEERAKILQESIWGNETDIGDKLAMGKGVGYGSNTKYDLGKIIH